MGFFSHIEHSVEHAIHHLVNIANNILNDVFGSSETVTNLSFTHIYKDTDQLYKHSFLTSYENEGNVFQSLLNKKIALLNNKILEINGFTATAQGIIKELTAGSIEAYLEQNNICLEPTVSSFKEETIYLLKLKDSLSSYQKFTNVIKPITEPTTNGTITENIEAFYYTDGNIYIPQTDSTGSIVNNGYSYSMVQLNFSNTETFTGDGSTDSFTLSKDTIYSITSVTINGTTVDYSVSGLYSSSTTITLTTTPNNGDSVDISYQYIDTTSTTINDITLYNDRNTFSCTYECNGETKYLYEFSDVVIQTVGSQEFLFIPFKENGVFNNFSKPQEIVLKKLGIDKNQIESSLSNSNIKNAILTFSTTSFTDEYYNDVFEEIYGSSTNQKTMIISDGATTIKYYWKDDLNGNTLLYCSVGSAEKLASDVGYLIPIKSLKEFPIKDFFNEYQRTATIVVETEQTETIQWYQSTLFSFVLTVVAIIICPVSAPYIMSSFMLSEVLSDIHLSPSERIAISMAMIAIGSYYGGSEENTINISTVSQVSTQLGQYYLTYKEKGVEKNIKETEEQTKTIEKQIDELKKQTIYFPMDRIGSYYDLQYSLLYNYNEMFCSTAIVSQINYEGI